MYQLSLSLSETTPPIIKIVGAFGFLFLTKLGISDHVEIYSFCVFVVWATRDATKRVPGCDFAHPGGRRASGDDSERFYES